ncbi:hypothetical protein CLAVI_000168 [Candidatus Clavichlamydia salmonicola]|nr:hypothetical protein [Candidatus Clavichlamydia salmonicola]
MFFLNAFFCSKDWNKGALLGKRNPFSSANLTSFGPKIGASSSIIEGSFKKTPQYGQEDSSIETYPSQFQHSCFSFVLFTKRTTFYCIYLI